MFARLQKSDCPKLYALNYTTIITIPYGGGVEIRNYNNIPFSNTLIYVSIKK